MVAIFLPLSAMLFFSFVTRMPQDGPGWQLTLQNFAVFLSNPTYPALLRKSLGLALVVSGLCVVIGYPCALVLAKSIRGHARAELFLMVILPFWSSSLVRIFPGPSCCAAMAFWSAGSRWLAVCAAGAIGQRQDHAFTHHCRVLFS